MEPVNPRQRNQLIADPIRLDRVGDSAKSAGSGAVPAAAHYTTDTSDSGSSAGVQRVFGEQYRPALWIIRPLDNNR